MAEQDSPPLQIQITEVLVRLYVLLAQHLDRCLSQAAGEQLPAEELEKHLTETRDRLLGFVSTNRVVQEKIEQEYNRIYKLGASCSAGTANASVKDEVKKERDVLQTKMIALSDLLAVFRSL